MPQNTQQRSEHTITPFTNIYLFFYLQILPFIPYLCPQSSPQNKFDIY